MRFDHSENGLTCRSPFNLRSGRKSWRLQSDSSRNQFAGTLRTITPNDLEYDTEQIGEPLADFYNFVFSYRPTQHFVASHRSVNLFTISNFLNIGKNVDGIIILQTHDSTSSFPSG